MNPARLAALLVAPLPALLLGACSSDAPAATGTPKTSHTVVGVDDEWDPDGFVVPAGEQISLTVENDDDGVAHNFHLLAPNGPKTKIEVGPAVQKVRFEIAEPGDYEFVCDIHPQMRGSVKAVPSDR